MFIGMASHTVFVAIASAVLRFRIIIKGIGKKEIMQCKFFVRLAPIPIQIRITYFEYNRSLSVIRSFFPPWQRGGGIIIISRRTLIIYIPKALHGRSVTILGLLLKDRYQLIKFLLC